MIADKHLEQLGFDIKVTKDPASETKFVTYKKGLLKVYRVDLYNSETGKHEKGDQTVFITLPAGGPWDNETPLINIKNITKLEQLDSLLNDN